MKELSEIQRESRNQQISQAYGQFLRAVLAQDTTQESSLQLDTLEKTVQRKLEAALAQETSADEATLYRLALTAGLEALRSAKQNTDELNLHWIDLQNTSLPINPEQFAQKAQEALSRLPENRRRTVGLHLAGFTISEIAELLGWDQNNTEQQLGKGMRSLRAALRAAGIDYESE